MTLGGERYTWENYGSLQPHLVGCFAAAWVLICFISFPLKIETQNVLPKINMILEVGLQAQSIHNHRTEGHQRWGIGYCQVPRLTQRRLENLTRNRLVKSGQARMKWVFVFVFLVQLVSKGKEWATRTNRTSPLGIFEASQSLVTSRDAPPC